MNAMSQLMGENGHIPQISAVIHQNKRLLGGRKAPAKGPTPFPFSQFCIDPPLIKAFGHDAMERGMEGSHGLKYTKGETEYILPPRIPPEARAEAERIGLEAYNALGCKGCARVDMMANEKGEVFVLEVNSMPGMTETSLVPKAAHFAGIDFPALVERILQGASLKAGIRKGEREERSGSSSSEGTM